MHPHPEIVRLLVLPCVVVSFRPSRDQDTCPTSIKQASYTWPLPGPLNKSSHLIQTPSSAGARRKR